MAPKSQSVSSTQDQPNPASSSTKATLDSGSHNNSSSHNTTHSPTAQPSTNNATPEHIAAPQPMSKSTATAGANLATKDIMSSSSQPSPYGTRSRNRGQARPNYAEDKDADMEMFDAVHEKKEEEPKKPSRQAGNSANGTADTPRTSIPTSRKGTSSTSSTSTATTTAAVTAAASTTSTDDSKPSTTATKDHQSVAVSSANATPSSASSSSSKKRKAATQSATNGANAHAAATTTQSSNASTANASTRRGTASAAPAATAASGGTGAGFRETNMLSFENCGAKPKDGKMIADDGTVLQHNGRTSRFRRCITFCWGGDADKLHRSRLSCMRTTWGALLPGSHHGIPAHAK